MAALKVNAIVQELAAVRGEIADIEAELMPLKAKEAELRSKQMKTLNSEITGETYVRTERFRAEVLDEKKAWEYAEKNEAVRRTIDTAKCLKLLRTPDGPMPEDVGFEVVSTESLSIRSNNEE